MEIKLAQELESVDQDPLFLEFFDISKAYYNLYCRKLIQTLVGYGEGPKLWGLVTCQNGFHGSQLRATRGTKQGVLDYPTLLNVELYTT